MARPGKPGTGEIDETPGIAGGPGPTPPGVEDGTVVPRRAQPETRAPPSPDAQRDEGAPQEPAEPRTRR